MVDGECASKENLESDLDLDIGFVNSTKAKTTNVTKIAKVSFHLYNCVTK